MKSRRFTGCPSNKGSYPTMDGAWCSTANLDQRCPLWVMCGRRRLGKNFLSCCSIGRVRSCDRPVLCGGEAAGHNALRGSGPNRKHAFKDALTHAGCPDPRIDLVCITSSVLANSFNFKRHRRCLSHLLESLWLTQPVYSTSIPRSRRRPQHQKQTSAHVRTMSALPPKSDIDRACRDVRFVPKADILRCGKNIVIRSPRRRWRAGLVEP